MLDILIPTYNRPTRLETVLYSLTLQQPKLPEGHRVIVCDDNSPIPVASIIDKFSNTINIELHRMDKNTGSAAVRRFLVSKIQQKFVLWLDDDVVLHEDAVAMHLTGCSVQTNPGISVGTMEDIPENHAEEILRLPLEERITACRQRCLPEGRHHFKDPHRNTKAWGACWTGNLMMLKAHGDKVGWLDEDVEGWGHDDTVLTVKLVGEGIPVWYDSRIRGFHLRQDAARKGNLGRDYWDTARQNAKIVDKYLQKYKINWDG